MKNTHTILRPGLLAALSLAIMLGIAAIAQACPTCKDALAAADPDSQNVVRGYFWSILFMMGMPYAVVTGFGIYMYVLVRRARAAKEAAQAAERSLAEQEPLASIDSVDAAASLQEPVEV